MLWDTWKKAFYAWEDSTAKYMEEVLKSPLLLAPSGMLLGGAMKAKASFDKQTASFVGNLGLATKRDQERSLHTLNQLESRLIDLEEKLSEALAKNKAN